MLEQRIGGLLLVACGVILPLIDGDATASLVLVPLGLLMLFSREYIMYNGDKRGGNKR